MIKRVQKSSAPDSTQPTPNVSTPEIRTTLSAAQSDPAINQTANYYTFRDKYDERKGKGSLDALIARSAHTAKEEQIKEKFLRDRQPSFVSSLAETLPLFANAQGRLGEYVTAKVTKTAKQDDQGGSFIDLVIEIKNDWIANGAPKDMQDLPAKMTFLVDVGGGEKFVSKVDAMRSKLLLYGEKAKVLCYEDSLGTLGIERPKLLVTQSPEYLEQTGTLLGSCITQSASDKFTVNRPREFDEAYRTYFVDLMNAIAENAKANAEYIGRLSNDNEKRARLKAEYERIVAFVEAYKKTPTTRPRVNAV